MQDLLRTLAEIWIYPIKSMGGIRVQKALLAAQGLQWDRRWMLLDEKGRFLTQRQLPDMALLEVSMNPDYLEVRHRQKELAPIQIPLEAEKPAELLTAPIWDDTSEALLVSQDANRWFSIALGRPCKLVFMPESGRRTVTGKTSGRQQKVSFADGYPILLTGQASLDELNSRLTAPVPMSRFRPNLVFSGGTPFEEDSWHSFSIGGKQFWAEKACARCIVTTIDQDTGKKVSKEPLATLASFRQWNHKILFGQNLLYETGGSLQVGEQIIINTYKESSFSRPS